MSSVPIGAWAGSSVEEHLTFNQGVAGSIPARLTKLDKIDNLHFGVQAGPAGGVGNRSVGLPEEPLAPEQLALEEILNLARLQADLIRGGRCVIKDPIGDLAAGADSAHLSR